MEPWQLYQNEATTFFRSIGLEATTDAIIAGSRTKHAIDVLVKTKYAGVEIIWIVECKHWITKVTKEKVFALRTIVIDVGADRGILLCESGFQSGALEAADLTNVTLTSLALLKERAANDIFAARMLALNERVLTCKALYWDIPKQVRIDKGLRFGGPEDTSLFSGARVIEFAQELLAHALRKTYPIAIDDLPPLPHMKLSTDLLSPSSVVELLEPMISDLESRLAPFKK